MTRVRLMVAAATLAVVIVALLTRTTVAAQQPAARPDSGDAAVAALVAEVRALRADMAASARNQLRAQMLLGRVQMQEQRLAYLDKQRLDAANAAALQTQIVAPMRAQFGQPNPCAGVP